MEGDLTSGGMDRRKAALLCAVAALEPADVAVRMLQRHPEADVLLAARSRVKAEFMPRLFMDDLQASYRHVPKSSFTRDRERLLPEAYWFRRRYLRKLRLWEQGAASLAPCWRMLASMGPLEFETACVSVGAEMIAYAAASESPGNVVRWLAPLGVKPARAVADRYVQLRGDPVSEELAGRWHYAYGRETRRYRGDGIKFALGLGLLSGMYQRLSGEQQTAVQAVLDSSVRNALERPVDEDLCGQGHEEEIHRMLEQALLSPSGDHVEERPEGAAVREVPLDGTSGRTDGPTTEPAENTP
jgi:hypothetical protein